jgi:gamma-glutamylcyclotransferase (GGCT)/AIG2-like uncharacterized protein YtfP
MDAGQHERKADRLAGRRENMHHLFAYGTLMCPDIMEEVSGSRLEGGAATVRGYRCACVTGEDYPALVPEEGGRVGGVVYFDVPEAAWERLERFEGEMYARQCVEVELESGERVTAAAYVVRPEHLSVTEAHDWSFAEFLRTGKARFQAGYKGYEALEGQWR